MFSLFRTLPTSWSRGMTCNQNSLLGDVSEELGLRPARFKAVVERQVGIRNGRENPLNIYQSSMSAL